jgi:hypothetical protein
MQPELERRLAFRQAVVTKESLENQMIAPMVEPERFELQMQNRMIQTTEILPASAFLAEEPKFQLDVNLLLM